MRDARPSLATVAGRLLNHKYRRQVLKQAYLDALSALPEAAAPSLELHLIALQTLQHIDHALDSLAPHVREAFLLAHIAELSYAEKHRHLRRLLNIGQGRADQLGYGMGFRV